MEPRIAVSILNWNQCGQALECIAAIDASRGVAPDLLVVDNGSRGDDVERLRRRVGSGAVLPLQSNRGYAGGMNAAIERWRARGRADPLLIITPDARVEPDTLRRLLEAQRCRPRAAAVGPLVVYRDGPDRLVGAGGRIDPSRLRAPMSRVPRGSEPYDVDWIDGCCMLLRPAAIEEVGGFDERFFAYFEETDLCRRLGGAGWEILVAPDAIVRHPKEEVARPIYYYYYMARNRFLFWSENFDAGFAAVALRLAGASARLAASWVKSLLLPGRWTESPARLRAFVRQLRGGLAGVRDHLRKRYGARNVSR